MQINYFIAIVVRMNKCYTGILRENIRENGKIAFTSHLLQYGKFLIVKSGHNIGSQITITGIMGNGLIW